MRNVARKMCTAVLCAGLSLMLFAVPSASAQLTETSEVLDSGETRVVQTLITDGGNTTVTVERIIAAEVATTTTEALLGDVLPVAPTEEYENRQGTASVTRPILETTVTTEENALACSPSDDDEVLGEVVLALTGSNVDLPIAIGAGLIGVGGLLVAATKKRRSDDS